LQLKGKLGYHFSQEDPTTEENYSNLGGGKGGGWGSADEPGCPMIHNYVNLLSWLVEGNEPKPLPGLPVANGKQNERFITNREVANRILRGTEKNSGISGKLPDR